MNCSVRHLFEDGQVGWGGDPCFFHLPMSHISTSHHAQNSTSPPHDLAGCAVRGSCAARAPALRPRGWCTSCVCALTPKDTMRFLPPLSLAFEKTKPVVQVGCTRVCASGMRKALAHRRQEARAPRPLSTFSSSPLHNPPYPPPLL